ncbi:prephenate dehydratase domain-containing protein [Vibrio fluvialis]|uniref:prephenate dehydratase domain-containing protein n=1 Tax=Vibrio fluvialis TaxID=676 RepID=UPI00068F8EEF|nr:prephenate dehydratase domain-containing protein [Vibrio fluvialis]
MATTGDHIYVQASKGSFNDAAITKLFEQQPALKAEVDFSGTPLNTFMQADLNDALAFSAVENSTINGRLVQATVEALQQYKVVGVKAFITTPIEMCVLMNSKDVEAKRSIALIASHPAALKQIDSWKQTLNAKELAVPEGTAAAAQRVSNGEMPDGTAAIGACVLEKVYPNLVVVEQGVQDNKNNKTSFLLMDVEKRVSPIGEADARKELEAAIKQGQKL